MATPFSPGPPGPAPAAKRSPAVAVSVAVAALALLATVGIAVWNFALSPVTTTVTDVTPTPTAEVTPEPTEAPPSETTPPPPPTTSPPPTTPPPPTLPEGVSPCPAVYGPVGGFTISAAGNDVTSCPFAEEVRRSYGANPTRNAPVVIPAFSPVTGVTYEMRCTGDGLVTCTGGNNAVVHLI